MGKLAVIFSIKNLRKVAGGQKATAVQVHLPVCRSMRVRLRLILYAARLLTRSFAACVYTHA